MKVENVKSNECTFQGNPTKGVRKIFHHLEKDIPLEDIREYGLMRPADVFEKLHNFVSETDPEIIFGYRKPSIFGRFSGFYFKNTKSGKILSATTNTANYTRRPVNRLSLLPPETHPENRYSLRRFRIEALDDKIEHSEKRAIDLCYADGNFALIQMPVVFLPSLLMKGLRTLCKPFMIKIQKQKYEFWNLKSMSKYVDELTSKYTPKEIDKLLQ